MASFWTFQELLFNGEEEWCCFFKVRGAGEMLRCLNGKSALRFSERSVKQWLQLKHQGGKPAAYTHFTDELLQKDTKWMKTKIINTYIFYFRGVLVGPHCRKARSKFPLDSSNWCASCDVFHQWNQTSWCWWNSHVWIRARSSYCARL